jgi:hypothetical protein
VQRLRRPVLAALATGVVVLVAGCSDPAPTEVPGSTVSAPPTSGAVSPAPSPSTTAGATPAGPSSPASQPPTQAQPTTGSDPSVVPSRPVETAPPKRLDESTRTAGAVVSLVSVRATTIKATTPGDRSGPGVLVRLKLVNSTGKTLDTSFTQVDVTDAGGTSGTLVDGAPTKALAASVRAGRDVQGTYAFLMDDASAGEVTVSVFVTSGQPVVTFRGRAA